MVKTILFNVKSNFFQIIRKSLRTNEIRLFQRVRPRCAGLVASAWVRLTEVLSGALRSGYKSRAARREFIQSISFSE